MIYRATELRPHRPVALKVVAPEFASNDEFRARFLRESQIAASLEHPNVVPVSRIGEEDGLLFIAMRFVPGNDLATLIADDGRLPPLRAAAIADQIADALDSAHEKGLVHRDVKPANVLIEHRRRGDHVYLTDFGLTKDLATNGRLTGTGIAVGTIDYMAPEQLEASGVDARVDVYSLGCLVFEMLAGRVPYAQGGQAAKMYAHLTEPPPKISQLVQGLSTRFDELVARALAKAPEDRYPSAGDLAEAMLAAAENRRTNRVERSIAMGDAAPLESRTVSNSHSDAVEASSAEELESQREPVGASASWAPGLSTDTDPQLRRPGALQQPDVAANSTEPSAASLDSDITSQLRFHTVETRSAPSGPPPAQHGGRDASNAQLSEGRSEDTDSEAKYGWRRGARLAAVAVAVAVGSVAVIRSGGNSSRSGHLNSIRTGPLTLSYGGNWLRTADLSPGKAALSSSTDVHGVSGLPISL